MTTSERKAATSAFRAPGAVDWRELVADNADQQEAARKANDKLKDVLHASLQIQRLVVLAGSGCSQSAGGPSMSDLWNAAIGEKPDDISKAIAGKIHYSLEPPDSRNIEAFLSQAEAFLQVENAEDVMGFLNRCKEEILKECSAFLDPARLGAHQTFLHRLFRRRVRDQRLKVFTTNYDLCFERAASELGGIAMDGFSFTAPRRYDSRFFGYDIIRRPRGAEDIGNYLEGVFLLYKLHGSVNWARLEDGTILEKDKPTPEEACLIYPVSGKYQQSFLQPHLESISQYLSILREPNTCVLVVGFGFNDDHLAEPLLSAVQSNPHLRLIVVDPELKTKATNGNRYWKRFLELSESGEDVWFINVSFADFAQMIPDLKALTPADVLMRAIKGVKRES